MSWYKMCTIQKCLFINKIFCFWAPVNLLFVNTAKLLLESRYAIISLAFASCDATDLETKIWLHDLL